MPVDPKKKEQESIDRAFELAYFIHANRGIALCVAEEAWRKLDQALGQQDKRRYYPPLRRQRRMRISMREEHLLQCLVYAESDAWERCTEQGDSPYPLTEEDMVIRFIKHLVRITVRRNALYVTLGVSQLLYEFGTSEVQQMYNVLLWDEKQFKDKSFVRQQRKVLMRDINERFADQIQTEKTAERGERFIPQRTTPRLIQLVKECLQRFTPWGTVCLIPASFPAQGKVAGLHFSGADPDEEHPIEMNRIHTILHPECFSRFIRGLGFDLRDERLAVPSFSFSTGGQPRGDRFHPPKLEAEDYLRLQRIREADARRRRVFLARQVDLYVDGIKQASFDPRQTSRFQLEVGPGAEVLEVRGQDAEGELTLAVLLLRSPWLPREEPFRDWIVMEGGQKVTIALTPIRDASQNIERTKVEVSYTEPHPLRALSWLAQRGWFGLTEMFGLRPKWFWVGATTVAMALTIMVATLIWFRHLSLPEAPTPPRIELARPPEIEPASPIPPSTPNVSPFPQESSLLIARAGWSMDPETMGQAIPIEALRGEAKPIDLSSRQMTVLISLPIYGPGDQPYTHYRLTLRTGEKSLSQRSLRAPHMVQNMPRHVLSVTLLPGQLPKAEAYELRVEGQTRNGWRQLGRVVLRA
ncbi:MAG: hypothetical protein HY314_10425 [Acidobacteria bacterium]|nr:hypothetical protein [Acidobacteriota bacterium]